MTQQRVRKAHRGTLGTNMRHYRNVDVRWCNPSQNKKVTSARSGKHLTEINPNRSLGRLLYPFSLFKVSLCHISISLCSMTLLGLGIASKLSLLSPWVTFGILSTSLSRRSPLRLRQRCGQSARNKYSSGINPNDRFGINVAPIRWRRYFVQHSPAVLDGNKG